MTSESDLFEPPMLYDFQDFGRVLATLSKLSRSARVREASGLGGFPPQALDSRQMHDYYNMELFRDLEDSV